MTCEFTIRLALREDASAVADIYGLYVRESAATFELEAPSLAETERRIVATLQAYPCLVAENAEGKVLGFCYAHALREREAYIRSAETTIYLAPEACGSGMAAALYSQLEMLLSRQGITNLYACITDSNLASMRFHEKCGFSKVAHFTNCGYKFNQWWGITWWEKIIASHDNPPQPFVIFPLLES